MRQDESEREATLSEHLLSRHRELVAKANATTDLVERIELLIAAQSYRRDAEAIAELAKKTP